MGATGAGKTTITNLTNPLLRHRRRQVRPTTASTSARKITSRTCVARSAFVLRFVKLFTGTVAQEHRYGRLDATDEKMHCRREARPMRAICASSVVCRERHVLTGNGSSLTGPGPAHRSRVPAVADPPAMILDLRQHSPRLLRAPGPCSRAWIASWRGRTINRDRPPPVGAVRNSRRDHGPRPRSHHQRGSHTTT